MCLPVILSSVSSEAFIGAMDLGKVLVPALKIELQEFKVILDPWNLEQTIEELRRIHTKFHFDTQTKLHKALSVFGTGIAIMDACMHVIGQRTSDVSLQQDFDAIYEQRPEKLKKERLYVAHGSAALIVPEPQ